MNKGRNKRIEDFSAQIRVQIEHTGGPQTSRYNWLRFIQETLLNE